MKKTSLFSALLFFLIIIISNGACDQNKPSLDVGVVLPLSGEAAVYGEKLNRGIELAQEQYVGRWRINFYYEDSKAKPLDAVSSFKFLRQRYDAKTMLGFFTSSELLAVAPLANREHVVLISPTASASIVSEAGPYIFRIASSDAYDAKVLASFVSNDLKKENIAVVYANNDYGVGINKEFKKYVEDLGGKLIASEGFAQGTNDFRTIIQKLKRKEPQAVLLVGYKEMGLFFRQAQELRLKTTFLSTGLLEDPKILKMASGSAEGVYYSMPAYQAGIDQELVDAFNKAFRAKYDMEPDIGAKLGYDLYNVFVAGLEKCNGNLQQLREGLLAIENFVGVTGAFRFEQNGDVIRSYGIKKVENNDFVWIVENYK